MRSIPFLASALMLAALPANASVQFSDGFETETPAISVLNFASFQNWTVSEGSVDLIRSGNFSITCRSGNFCVDLDGSTRNPGVLTLSSPIAFSAGDFVSGEWYLSGNQRTAETDVIRMTAAFGAGASLGDFTWFVGNAPAVVLGDQNSATFVSFTYPIVGADPFTRYAFSFNAVSDGAFTFAFSNQGGDNVGAILDDVSFSVVGAAGAIPEPATWAMLIAGFGLVGIAARRRRNAVTG